MASTDGDKMGVQNIVEDITGSAVLVLIAGFFIYILLAMGNAFARLSDGAATQSITAYGILAIMAIVTISGFASLIKFVRWINESSSGLEF